MAPDPADNAEPDEKAKRIQGLRRKLQKLNRRQLPDREPSGPAAPGPAPPAAESAPPEAAAAHRIVYRRDLPRQERRAVEDGGGISIPLDQLVEGTEATCPRGQPFLLIERAVSDIEPEAATLHETLDRTLEALAQRTPRKGHEPIVARPQDLMFLDLETTGLGSSPVFLVGTLVCRDGEVVARQLLARTYAEEMAIVGHFVERSRARPVFVTFNGKSFDVPYLRVRAVATGVPFYEPTHHVDLLHAARRVYRGRLPDCKLQTLERYVCQRDRGDDIPGSEIPAAYHAFVRTGDGRDMARIIDHNLHDLVTMVHLLARLLLGRQAAPRADGAGPPTEDGG